jgi:hypothetical protein
MLALVDPSVVTVALVPFSVVIVAVVAVKILIEALFAIDKLLGFVPSSTTALLLSMVNRRLSAVLTATSAPPAKFVRFAVVGTELGVSLFFNRIVGISRCLR